jgi:class 3 adenylate cyclase
MTLTEEAAPPSAQERDKPSRSRPPRRFGLSIQSKLLIMLLGVSLVAAIIVGVIGYSNGRRSLQEAAVDRLTTIRELRSAQIKDFLDGARRGVLLDSRNLSARQASTAFNRGWDELQSAPLAPAVVDGVQAYYRDTFIPAYEKRSQREQSGTAFIPRSRAGQYLQFHYTAKFDDFDQALASDDAGDGSAWSSAHATYHDYFRRLVSEVGYEDLLVLNLDGDVVYSAYKGIDLGISMDSTTYRESALAQVYRAAVASTSADTVEIRDMEPWAPSEGRHALWVASPIGDGDRVTGVLAAQISLDQVNAVMTGDQQWDRDGLGTSGEVYLAGRNKRMRSLSREIIESPDTYADRVIANGTPPTIAQRMAFLGGTVGLQPVETQAVEAALSGETGTAIGKEYIGGESITAYAPVEIQGLDWVIVARIEASEAFAAVTSFTRTLLLSLLAIVVAVTILSLILAQVFSTPVRRLVDAVRRLAGGDLAVQVPAGSRDEFGDLGSAFNDMAASLRIKQDLIDVQRAENTKLMRTLMPETLAERYRQGEETIAEQHDNVSVVFAELVGFDDFAESLTGAEEIAQLNALMRGFDEMAEKVGVEKVRTLRGGYLASSGVVVPRVDNARRAVEFAVAMAAVLERFNTQHGTQIGLRAGVDTGAVTSGLVARTNMAYDLWGDAVSLAHRVRAVSGEPGIYLSQTVRDRVQDMFTTQEIGTVELRGKAQPVWKVVTE